MTSQNVFLSFITGVFHLLCIVCAGVNLSEMKFQTLSFDVVSNEMSTKNKNFTITSCLMQRHMRIFD